MDSTKHTLEKQLIVPYFEKWNSMKPEIQNKYDLKEGAVSGWMNEAISNYEKLLQECSLVSGTDRRTKMEPLNGEERLQFVKAKINSPFALIQLDLLHSELRKKVSRFLT